MKHKKKILILATNYPNLNGGISLYYIHTRNVAYIEEFDITVLNFTAKENYYIDGVKVITYDFFKKDKNEKYDLLVSHAPNLRKHYTFFKKYGNLFAKYIFFFHGHEVLMINKTYPKEYSFKKEYILKKVLQNAYDSLKLKVWKKFFTKYNYKSNYIFVSNWMKEEFLKWVKIDESIIADNSYITYNSVGKEFEEQEYNTEPENKEYDFITVRGNLDGAKYCIDIVNTIANNNNNLKFLIIGNGEFFKHYKKSDNIELIQKGMSHEEIIGYLNKSKCALMPTRTDAQGLMACEMATFGIPLITSDLEVCHEVFDDFKNVAFIDNDKVEFENIIEKYNKISLEYFEKNQKYFRKNTCEKEINIFKQVLAEQNKENN